MKVSQIIIAITISILIGILLSQLGIFGLMPFLLILLLGIFFSGIGLLGGIVKKNSKVVKLNLGIIGLIFICGISISVSSRIYNYKKQEKANRIILKLENHKVEFGKYPKKLSDVLENSSEQRYSYRTDSTQLNFHLNYLIDGWHFSEYSSKTEKWITGD